MENNGKTQETADSKLQSDAHLMKKFAKSGSSAEIKVTGDKITASDPDIDSEKLDDKAAQFHKEKKEDAQEQAANDAQFEQP